VSKTVITKEGLRKIGFRPYDKNEIEWSWDGDRIMYHFTERALYDADEVYGNDIKLCVIKTIEELIEMVYSYFNEDINDYEE